MKPQLALIVLSPLLMAATPFERQVFSAPMPHVTAGGSGTLKVHYVRLLATRTAREIADHQKLLHSQVKTCSEVNARIGKPVRPPREYPDLDKSYMTDSYWAPNYAVTYNRHYVAGINGEDCSLIEIESHTAWVNSAYGNCKVNLLKRTFTGRCDAAAHRAAAVFPARPLTEQQKKAARRRQVAGVECTHVTGPMGSACFALGGASPVPWLLGARADIGIPVAIQLPFEVAEALATQVAFDAHISPAVFTPQLALGMRSR